MARRSLHLLFVVTYIVATSLSFYFEVYDLFFYLTLPWSWLMAIFAWTIFHVVIDGIWFIRVIQLVGAGVNVAIYLFSVFVIGSFRVSRTRS